MNAASWIILGIVILIVGIILFFLFKNRGNTCSCGRTDCNLCKKNVNCNKRRK